MIMNICNDPLLKDFFRERELRESTIGRYTSAMTHYCTMTGMTPSELIKEAEEEEETIHKLRNRKIKQYIFDYKDMLKEKGLSPTTINHHLSVVKTFYRSYDIRTPDIKFEKYVVDMNINSLPNKEHIRTALTLANKKYSAIILLMSSSGMGVSEVRSLTYETFLDSIRDDVEDALNDPLNIGEVWSKVTRIMDTQMVIPTWQIKRVKTHADYFTFSSPESVYAILEYLKTAPPNHLNSPLFRGHAHYEKPLTKIAIQIYFSNINKECNWGKRGRQIFFRSHNLRKWFASTLYKNEVPQLTVDWMLGHRIDPVTSAYFKSDPDKLKEIYTRVLPELSIREVHAPQVDTRELLKRIEFLERKEKARMELEKGEKELKEKGH